jgi:hypothetical protein
MSQSATGARLITTPTSNNEHLQDCLHSLKSSIESRLSYNVLGKLMKSIKNGKFSEPTLNMTNYQKFNSASNQKKQENHSISTWDSDSEYRGMALEKSSMTASKNELLFNSPNRPSTSSKIHHHSSRITTSQKVQGPKLNKEEMKIVSERIAAGDKKVKTIIHILFRFEEQSIIENVIDSAKLKIFRSKSRTLLGKVMSNYETFRFQHSESISLSILLLSAVKIGMSKKQFLSIVTKISSKKPKKVEVIKKSKCYSMLKHLRAASTSSEERKL